LSAMIQRCSEEAVKKVAARLILPDRILQSSYTCSSNRKQMQWELVGWCAALLTMFGFVPQILKIYRTESVSDVSLIMLLQFSLGMFLWLLYGLYIQDRILIVSNTISFLTLMVATGMYMKYRKSGASPL